MLEILNKHAVNCDIRVVGEFDEPEWSVLPPPDTGASVMLSHRVNRPTSPNSIGNKTLNTCKSIKSIKSIDTIVSISYSRCQA